jgi:hypothetical protein
VAVIWKKKTHISLFLILFYFFLRKGERRWEERVAEDDRDLPSSFPTMSLMVLCSLDTNRY